MDAEQLFNHLIADAGLDDVTRNQLLALAKNDKIAAKAATFANRSELEQIETQKKTLEASYAKASNYEKWYGENYPLIEKLQRERALYEERYGALDAAGGTGGNGGNGAAAGMTQADIDKLLTERLEKLTGHMSNTLIAVQKVTERHVRRGRKDELDWAKLQELATSKTGGNIEAAYEEWDTPNKEAEAKLATDKEIERRVNEELAKRATQFSFPAGADGGGSSSPSPLTRSRGTDKPTYNRDAVIAAAISGKAN